MHDLHLNETDKELLSTIQEIGQQLNTEVFVVGGAVRCWLLDYPIDDVDLVCFGHTATLAAALARYFKSRVIVLNNYNGVLRIPIANGKYLDLCNGGTSLKEDAQKRDFSLNAIYLHLDSNGQVIITDPLAASEDLDNRRLKAISPQIFRQDPLRLVRAFRLSAEFNLQIEESTYNLIKENVFLLSLCAPERLHEEWVKICLHNSCHILPLMAQSGVLTELFPALKNCQNISQPPEHYWDVFEHSLACICAVDYLIGQSDWPYLNNQPNYVFSDPLVKEELQNSIIALKTAALLHDIGKPSCRTEEEDSKRIRFIGHPVESENMCRTFLPVMRFTKKESAQICALVRDHMRPTQLAPKGQVPSVKAVFRFFRDNPHAISVLYLSLADHLATCGPRLDLTEWQKHNETIKYVILSARAQEQQLKQSIPINGQEIISYLHLPPSPWIAFALNEAHAAQAEGTGRNEALRRAEMAYKHQLRALGLLKEK